ncbi:hypothetical protein INT45_000935 [Circinella minor]|uniref:Uncharacterized protein n=1 Tax=Circinella minor TaxID=1195481 RepID=A0A8H7VMX9_9FUNG|nr:hypothetical protein INT45_000935 [Circinella minor]
MSSPGFWNPRSNPPQPGSMYKEQKKGEQSFWYPRQYDMSSVAWGDKELWSQKDPSDEIQYTYWKKSVPKDKK